MFRIVGELLHPIAQLRHMHAQVLRSLHIGHASLLDQPHSLKLELAGKLPSLHDPPPAPSKHLTRCHPNRVQATHCTWMQGTKSGTIKPLMMSARTVLKMLGIEHNEKQWTAAELHAEVKRFQEVGKDLALFMKRYGL